VGASLGAIYTHYGLVFDSLGKDISIARLLALFIIFIESLKQTLDIDSPLATIPFRQIDLLDMRMSTFNNTSAVWRVFHYGKETEVLT
jgi:hypothetical protein